MDRNQLTNDTEVAIRYGLDGRQAVMWTALPCIVSKVNLSAMTLECQPAIQGMITAPDGSQSPVNLPLLVDVPIVFPSAGGFTLTFPIAVGDEVLVAFSSRCIDAWWQNGNVQPPIETRMHDLSDGFAIPGPRSQPKVINGGISSTKVQLRSDDGSFVFGLDKTTGLFQMQNSTQSLNSVLSNLNTYLITFATGLTPANLTAKAAALVTSLGILATSISELLE
jgi:Phage protein Gp138 N-terminal domain